MGKHCWFNGAVTLNIDDNVQIREKQPTGSCATDLILVSGSFCRVRAFCPSSQGHRIQERTASKADYNGKI